jgi:hypothetical protein
VLNVANPNSFQFNPFAIREKALNLNACRTAVDIYAKIGNNMARPFNIGCIDPTRRRVSLANATTMTDYMLNSGVGNGVTAGSFLNGVMLYALINWANDPNVNPTGDPTAEYWAKRMADFLWQANDAADGIPPCLVPGMPFQGMYPHEWAYDIITQISGLCSGYSAQLSNSAISGGVQYAWDYWSIYGVVWPAYAYFYQKTGNAIITGSNPPITYGNAYQSMFSWGAVYSYQSGPYAAINLMKTLGEVGLWQFDALQWMQGTTAPVPLSITTTSLPSGIVGTPYTATLVADGGTPPYTWAAPTLPMGLTLNSTTGQISGTPSVATTGNIGITVTDSASPSAMATASLPLTINSAPVISALPGVVYPIP